MDSGDYIIYMDGGQQWIGKVKAVFSQSVEVQDVRVSRKGKRLKATLLWTDQDGVLMQSNYVPKNSEQVIYRIDRRTVKEIVSLDRHFLPDGTDVVVFD